MNSNCRILIVDDNRAIHDDFRKILAPPPKGDTALNALEDALFGESSPAIPPAEYDITSAYQGHEGFELVRKAQAAGKPFSMAFVDVRMPPGWDGVETVKHLWRVSPTLPVVICTAFSDYSWDQISGHLGNAGWLEILRKPFDPTEVQDLVSKIADEKPPRS